MARREGFDRIGGYARDYLVCRALRMALASPMTVRERTRIAELPEILVRRLKPQAGEPYTSASRATRGVRVYYTNK